MLAPITAHLLVPTNFGRASRAARRAALRWAMGTDARVTLLHVAPGPFTAEGLGTLELLHLSVRNHSLDRLRRYASLQRLRELHPELTDQVDIGVAWRQGHVIDEIVRFAQEEEVDAILLGERHRRFRIPWKPTICQSLLNRVECQVVLIHERAKKSNQSKAPLGGSSYNATGWFNSLGWNQ